ncbi:MAG: alpha/beta hydrolase [Pseudomonadota bacterium]
MDMQTYTITTDEGLSLYARSQGSDTDQLPMICLHGLTRNAADFDDIAAILASDRKVYALDFRGRSRSDYDTNWRNYIPPVYVQDVLAMMDQLNISRAVFCGTSLGGLVTMLLAQATPDKVAAAILNDIGPVIEADGLARIQTYTGALPGASDWDDALQQLKTIYGATLQDLDDDDFMRLCRRTYREQPDGSLAFDYDQNVGRAIREVDMQLGDPWQLFAALHDIPTLVLRGELSDILGAATVAEMAAQHPNLVSATIANRGHVPLLNEPDSVAAIQQFLGAIS